MITKKENLDSTVNLDFQSQTGNDSNPLLSFDNLPNSPFTRSLLTLTHSAVNSINNNLKRAKT